MRRSPGLLAGRSALDLRDLDECLTDLSDLVAVIDDVDAGVEAIARSLSYTYSGIPVRIPYVSVPIVPYFSSLACASVVE